MTHQNLGGGDLVPLDQASIIVIRWTQISLQNEDIARLAFDQVRGAASRMAVSHTWIEECCDAGSLLDPQQYRVQFSPDVDEEGHESEDDVDGSLQRNDSPSKGSQPIYVSAGATHSSEPSYRERSVSSSSSFFSTPTPTRPSSKPSPGTATDNPRNHKRLKAVHVTSEDRKDYDYLATNFSIWLRTPERSSQARFLANLKPTVSVV